MQRVFRLSAGRGARWRVARAVAAFVIAASAPALDAQTIVPNAHLDAQLAPWSRFVSLPPDPVGSGEEPVWQSPPDVNDSATSGSARVRLTPSSLNAKSGIAQCVDFAAPTSIAFLNYGMAFRVPAAAAIDGATRATVEVRLYAGTGCTGFLSGGLQAQSLAEVSVSPATWYRIGETSFKPNDAPVTAASAQVRGYLHQAGGQPTQSDYAVNLDHFVLVLNSTTPVELIRFEID